MRRFFASTALVGTLVWSLIGGEYSPTWATSSRYTCAAGGYGYSYIPPHGWRIRQECASSLDSYFSSIDRRAGVGAKISGGPASGLKDGPARVRDLYHPEFYSSRPGRYLVKIIGGVPFRVMSFVTAIKPGKMPFYMLLAGTVLDHTEYDFAGVVQAIQNRSYKAQVAEVNATLQSLRILNARAATPPATVLTLSGSGEKQSDTFRTSAPFHISWDTKFDGVGAFSIVLYANDGLPIALIANTLFQVSKHQTTVDDDCSRGCYLKVTAVGVHWTIAVTA